MTTSVAALRPASLTTRVRRRQWLRQLRAAALTPRGAAGLAIDTFVVLVAVVGPFVSPYSPTQFVTATFNRPSVHALLGGDDLGRDVLSRVLNGGWKLLLMSLAATAIGVFIGAIAGISAAYFRGRVDGLIMRTVDVILAFPQLVFAILMVSIIGAKVWLIVLVVGISHAPAVARVLRSTTLDISERDYVRSVELLGVRPRAVMTSEILPNLVSPLMVESGLRFTWSIVVMTGLSFLGFGLPPGAPNWGYMIFENQVGMSSNPWGVVVPAILIALLTIGTNTFTDAFARVAIGVEMRPEQAELIDDVGSDL